MESREALLRRWAVIETQMLLWEDKWALWTMDRRVYFVTMPIWVWS